MHQVSNHNRGGAGDARAAVDEGAAAAAVALVEEGGAAREVLAHLGRRVGAVLIWAEMYGSDPGGEE